MLPHTPLTSAFPVQARRCPKCRQEYAVVRADLIRPDVFAATNQEELEQCLACFAIEAAPFPGLMDRIRQHRERAYGVNLHCRATAG